MGVTITTALLIWFASSLVEYKVISSSPRLKSLFDNRLLGIIISLAIGAGVAFVLGIPTGVGVALGQLIGLATNSATYAFFAFSEKTFKWARTTNHAYKGWWDSVDRKRLHDAKMTLVYGAKGIAAMFMAFMFVVGLPFRGIAAWQRNVSPRIHTLKVRVAR